MKEETTTEEKYQEFRSLGYDHQTARELALLADNVAQAT